LRVCVVLKYWIENQYVDLYTTLVNELTEFTKSRLPLDGHGDLAKQLQKLLITRQEEAFARTQSLYVDPFSPLQITQDKMSPYGLFMELNESEIARQLTLIEFDLFSRIAPSELCNQAWNKQKLQHQAPHILAMIARANHLSYWVASFILWAPSLVDRVKIVSKFIKIAQHLNELKNFNTMMSVVAGINMSPVHRLGLTLKALDPSVKAVFDTMQVILQPSSSFKNYREALSKCHPPCLPYLGTYLTDLTFMEDGNSDMTTVAESVANPTTVDKEKDKKDKTKKTTKSTIHQPPPETTKTVTLINFAKRELVYGVMREIRMYQETKYRFPLVEPIATFMTALPFWDEKELYELSLQREARQS